MGVVHWLVINVHAILCPVMGSILNSIIHPWCSNMPLSISPLLEMSIIIKQMHFWIFLWIDAHNFTWWIFTNSCKVILLIFTCSMYAWFDLVICTINIIQQAPNFLFLKLRLFQIPQCVITSLHAVKILLEREHILSFEVEILHIGLCYVHIPPPFRRTIIVLK